jgi:hypothetical protein
MTFLSQDLNEPTTLLNPVNMHAEVLADKQDLESPMGMTAT